MPSVFETVTTVLAQGDNMSKLASLVGIDDSQAASAVECASPAILAGIAEKTSEPGGLGAVVGILDGLDDSLLGNIGAFLEGGDPRIGSGLLDGVFGARGSTLLTAVTARSGVAESTVGRIMPMVAPVVVGVLKQRTAADQLDAAGLNALLGNEKAELERRGLINASSSGRAAVGVGAVATAGSVAGPAATKADAGVGAVKGAVAGATATLAGAPGDAVDRVADAVDTGVDATMESKEKSTVASTNAGGLANPVRSDGGGGRASSWLTWVVAGLATVLILGWLLSQCGSDSDTSTGTGDPTENAESEISGSGEEGAADSATESQSDSIDQTAGSDDDNTEAADGSETDPDTTTAIQEAVDAALALTGTAGLSATVLDDGTVELAGSVDSEDAKTAAEAALGGIDGVTSIDNRIIVEAATDDAEEQPTINEELSLDPITFEVSSAQITSAGRSVLDQAATYLTANADVQVEIAGHTDSDGEDQANLVLSQARAESVKAYLEGKGIEGARMEAKGYGETQPVASNDTASGKAENRRIEFVIL